MQPWLRYVIAFVVFAHGFVYVRIGSVLPGPIQAWRGTSSGYSAMAALVIHSDDSSSCCTWPPAS